MDGTLWSFDGFYMMIHMLRNMDPKAPSGKLHNQHPYLVLNCLIKRYTYHCWEPLEFLKIYLICSSNGFTNTLTLRIYEIECCYLHSMKQTQFYAKNCRSVDSKFVKLSDELITSSRRTCQWIPSLIFVNVIIF